MPIKWPKGKRPVFVGTGNTVAVRYGDRSLSSLANEAALEAIADAELEPSDIDGISVYPMAPYANARNIPGYDIVDEVHMQHILPLKNVRWTCNSGNKMAVTSIIEAANALASGAVSYVLVYRALHHPAGERYNLTPPGAAADEAPVATALRLRHRRQPSPGLGLHALSGEVRGASRGDGRGGP